MSHEIKTPLNAIIGFTEAPEMGINADEVEKRNETLQIISSAGKQLNGLNGDILDHSTIEAGQVDLDIDKASPSVVVMQTLPFIKHLIEKNQVIVTRNFQSTKDVSVVSARLSQMLINFFRTRPSKTKLMVKLKLVLSICLMDTFASM